MSRSDRQPSRVIREVVLTLGALIGVVCIVATLAAAVFGLRALVFRSGSMSPTITTGALAVAKNVPASELKIGDIVMVKTAGGTNVTHRIVTVTHRGGSADLGLKGDANKVVDSQVYTVTDANRVWFAIPKVGYLVSWLSGSIGLFLLGLYAAFLLFVLFVDPNRNGGSGGGKPDQAGRSGGGRRAERAPRGLGSRSAMVAVVAAVISIGTVSASGPSSAAWLDPIAVSGTNLKAGTVPIPATFTCGALGLGSVTVNWTAVAGATSYRVFSASGATSADVGTATTTQITAPTVGNKTAWVVANHNYGSVTWTSAASTTRTYSITLLVLGLCN